MMVPKTERFELRLDEETLDQIDTWRGKQKTLVTRAEAVRRLIDVGLTLDQKDRISLTPGEILIATMVGDLMKHGGVKGEIDPDFVQETLASGNYWGLAWKYDAFFRGDTVAYDTVIEVTQILNVWRFIKWGIEKLSSSDLMRLEKEMGSLPIEKNFPGFDGNEETAYLATAMYLIEELERFQEVDVAFLNSHRESLPRYRRMVNAFESMQKPPWGATASVEQIAMLLKA